MLVQSVCLSAVVRFLRCARELLTVQLFSEQVEEHGEVDGACGFSQHVLQLSVLHVQFTWGDSTPVHITPAKKSLLTEFICDHSYRPREAYVSLRSSLSMKPSRFWSMSVKAWIQTTDTREIKTWSERRSEWGLYLFELLDLSLFEHGEHVGRRSLGSFGSSLLLLRLSARLQQPTETFSKHSICCNEMMSSCSLLIFLSLHDFKRSHEFKICFFYNISFQDNPWRQTGRSSESWSSRAETTR